jgi:hypothetical protein
MFISCEKEDNFIASADENLVAEDYAAQADALLAQLRPAEMEFVAPEDIAAFRKGPKPKAFYVERTSLRTNLKWQPILALFYCNTGDGIVTGTGPWYATRHNANILIEQDLNVSRWFEDGKGIITDHEGAMLKLSFTVYPHYKAQDGMRQYLKATVLSGTGIFSESVGNLDLNALIRPGHGYPVVILARGWVCYEKEA